MAKRNYFDDIKKAATKVSDTFTGIPTVGRSISDAVVSKVYQPQIEAQNRRQDELDRQLLEQSRRQGTKLPASYGKGKQTLEGSILGGRDLTTPEKAREGFTNLAGVAAMGYAPGLKAATSGRFLLPKAAKAATKAIPILSSKSPTIRLAANSALRGVENALPQAAVDIATKQDRNTILKNAGTNVALGAGLNTLLSPKLLKAAYKESAPIIRNAAKNVDNAITNRQFYKPVAENAKSRLRNAGKFATNKDLFERNIRLSTLRQAEQEGVDLATVVDPYGNYNPNNEPVIKISVDPETNTLQGGVSSSKEVQRYINERAKGNILAKIDETKLGTDEDFNNEFIADRVAKQATTEELLDIERAIKGGKVAYRTATEKPIDTTEYVQQQIAKRNAAKPKKDNSGFIKNIGSEIKKKFEDFTEPINARLDEAQKKGKYQLLPSKNIRYQIDRVLRSGSIAKSHIEQNLIPVINEVKDLDTFDQYLIAKQALKVEELGKKTGRNLEMDQKLVDEFGPVYEQAAQKIHAYSRDLLDRSVKSGLISQDLAENLKKKYPDYVPLQRIMDEVEAPNVGGGAGVGSVSKQTVVQSLKGSEREIDSPIESLIENSVRIFKQIEKNNTGNILARYKDLPDNPFGVVPLRTAENVKERIDLYSQAKDLKPVQNILQEMLKTRSKWQKSLESEINKLNQQGLYTSLRSAGKTENPKIISKTVTKTVAGMIKENAPVSIDNLSNSYSVKNLLVKEYGRGKSGMQKLAADVFNGGWNQLIELNPEITKKTAMSIVEQVFKEPTVIPQKITRETKYAIPSRGELKQIVNNLVNLPSSDIKAIKSKIATRENKLGPILDEIDKMSELLQSVKQQRGLLIDEARLLRDAETRGKKTFSTFKDGIREIYEADPEIVDALKALDVKQMGVVERAVSIFTRALRAGATTFNVPFTVTNVAKDQAGSFTNRSASLKAEAENVKNFVQGLWSAAGKDDLYQRWQQSGAGGTSYDLSRDNSTEKIVAQARSLKDTKSRIAYIAKNPEEILSAIEDFIGKSEETTRIQNFKTAYDDAIRSGYSPKNAEVLAAEASRTLTGNFQRYGEWSRALNAVIPFFNAGVQGARSTREAIKRNPAQYFARLSVGTLLPISAVLAWNFSDEDRKRAYDEILDYEKEGNLIFVLSGTRGEDGRYPAIKIPISPSTKNIANIARRQLEGLNKFDPETFKEVTKDLVQFSTSVDLSNPVSTYTPQALKTPIENATNTNLFTGAPVVPRSLENLPAGMQFDDKTSLTSKTIGGALNISPKKIDNAIGTNFAGVGQQALNLSDRLLGSETPGGKSITESLSQRFTSAKGGAEENRQYENEDRIKTIKSIEKRAAEGLITQQQANQAIARLGGGSQPVQQSGEIAKSAADGKYYFINSKGERDSYDTMRKAEIGKAKDDVRSGKLDKATVGDFEYTLDEDGEVQSRNTVTYKIDLLKEQENAAKEADNYADYEKYSVQRAAIVYKQLQKVDQESDPVKYLKLKGDLDDIVKSVVKYRSYGNAFKKPKKAKKPKKIPVRGSAGIRKIKGL